MCVCVECVAGVRLTFASRCRDMIHSSAVREISVFAPVISPNCCQKVIDNYGPNEQAMMDSSDTFCTHILVLLSL